MGWKKISWGRIRHNYWPRIWWYLSGMFVWDEAYSFFWLNIARRRQIWTDADKDFCDRRWCRYCGKGVWKRP